MSKETIIKQASEEIKEVLKKYDLAGAIALHTPNYSEFFLHMITTYSCVHQIDDNQIRIYSKQADYSTKEEHIDRMTNSSNMLELLKNSTSTLFGTIDRLGKMIDEATGAIHEPITNNNN